MTDAPEHDLVLVVDFGAQYAQLIARRVREARVYSEIVPHDMPVAEMLAKGPKAIILSGGPSSVYAEGAPSMDPAMFTSGTPVFGMCYGFQLMALGLGGTVDNNGAREYGRTPVTIGEHGVLLEGIPAQHNVWMSHGDSVSRAPEGFSVLASTEGTPVAAFENVEAGFAGVQWHPEVMHSEHGQRILEHFLWNIAKCAPTWTIGNIAEEPDRVDFYQQGAGALISYWDTSYDDNNVGDHPGGGLILPVDAHPEFVHTPDGNLARPRTSSFDAAFGLDRKKSQEIDWLGDPFELPKIRPVSTFDDTLDWWYAGDEHGTDSHPGRYQQGWSSVDVPKTGTTITVKKVKKNGVMVIKVGTSS